MEGWRGGGAQVQETPNLERINCKTPSEKRPEFLPINEENKAPTTPQCAARAPEGPPGRFQTNLSQDLPGSGRQRHFAFLGFFGFF